MNATTVFEERKEEFSARLQAAPDAAACVAEARFVLEQIACVLAQEENDSLARQRQQAVLACAQRAPSLLACARAQGELVLAPQKNMRTAPARRFGPRAVGAVILAVLAAYEAIDGRLLFAALQAAGAALLCFGGGALSLPLASGGAQARGVLSMDADALLSAIGDLCRAADVCVSDLAILEREAGFSRLSGTADEAMLDLIGAMLEAKSSGREDAAVRTLSMAEQYLSMLGMEAVFYSADSAALFDVLPTLSGERTIRPAFVREGKVIRRGVAAKAAERSAGA